MNPVSFDFDDEVLDPRLAAVKCDAALFAERGLVVVPTRGAPTRDHMVTTWHDGVPYTFAMRNAHGELDLSGVEHGMKHFRLTVERHHALVKATYEHMVSEGLPNSWAMLGGGSQLQAFLSGPAGYKAILYLTLEDLDDQERLAKSGYLAACGNESFTLHVQSAARNMRYFKSLNHPNIRVR